MRGDVRSTGETVVVGYVRRAHGLQGELLVHLQTDYPEETFRVGRVFQVTEGAPLGLPRDLTLESARPHGGGWILGFREIEDRTLAERYGKAHLSLRREELVEPATGEYFLHDLVGLDVATEEGVVGTVTGVYDTPGRQLLNVELRSEEAAGREVLVPFGRTFVEEVDLEEGVVRIHPPPGLLEL